MLLLSSSRRRRILFATVALVAGGYVSYRAYNSSALSRKRKQLCQIISSLSILGESVSQSAESLSIVSHDLKSFLLSDGDSVPQSLRQVFKIGQCPEFQGTVTVLSAALFQGMLRGVKGNAGKQGRGGASKVEGRKGRQLGKVDRGSQNHSSQDAACREIREVGFTALREEVRRSTEILEDNCYLECEEKREVIPSLEEGFEWEAGTNLSGADLQLVSSKKANLLLDRARRGQTENKPSQDLPERLLAKLFSEPGVGFASAVVGSFARNCVTVLLDGSRNRQTDISGPFMRGQVSSLGGSPNSQHLDTQPTADKKTPGIVDVICTDECRTLIAECIQNFVSTAVSVYVDKTKDVNFYDDMVAGITNPSHRAPLKDVLTSVCNGSVETLIRTTHDVMFEKKTGQSGSDTSYQQQQCNAQESSEAGIHSIRVGKDFNMRSQVPPISTMTQQVTAIGNTLQRFKSDSCFSSGSGEVCEVDAQSNLDSRKEHNQVNTALWKNGEESSGVPSFIVGLSKTLAIPSNRRLVLDVAGSMTAEAIKSFVDVVMSTARSYFSTKSNGGCNRVKGGAPEQTDGQACQLQTKSRTGMTDVAMKSFLLATICLAICLHVLAGVYGLGHL